MRRAGHTLTIDEVLTTIDHVICPISTPITVNGIPVDEAEYIGGRIELTQERTNVVSASAVISMITEVLSVRPSKRIENILKNFGEEYGLI